MIVCAINYLFTLSLADTAIGTVMAFYNCVPAFDLSQIPWTFSIYIRQWLLS
jgi:hypothetical protein